MNGLLKDLRGLRFIGVAELAEQAAKILTAGGPIQERGTVTDIPDERTIRYYLSEGLLSTAEEKQGTASVFGYIHLLQLLVVKRLQAEHLPIRKIKEIVVGRSERELERLFGEGRETSKNEAMSYLEALLKPTKASISSHSMRAAQPTPPAVVHSQPLPRLPEQQAGAGRWERVEIEPGLELHIREDYRPSNEAKTSRRLSQTVLHAIESFRQRLGKRGR